MDVSKLPPPAAKWSELYTAHDAMWEDSERSGSLGAPILLGGSFALAYILFYIYITNGGNVGIWDFWPVIPLFLIVFAINNGVSRAAINFFNSFYLHSGNSNPSKLISLRLEGISPLPAPLVMLTKSQYPLVVIDIKAVTDGKFNLAEQSVYWLGGPATLVVLDGTGLYLQRGNRFSRTLGPGVHFLERFETIREIVDLRPQTLRSGQAGMPPSIHGRTKDGIKIKFNLEITFHLIHAEPEKRKPADQVKRSRRLTRAEKEAAELYLVGTPLDSGDLEAIRKAVERTTVRHSRSGNDHEYTQATWRDGVWGVISGDMSKYITKHYLDELLIFEEVVENRSLASFEDEGETIEPRDLVSRTGQLLSGQERDRLRQEFDVFLREKSGVTLTSLRIVDFDVPPEVYEQRLLMLEAERSSHIKRIDGHAAAENILTREEARSRGQRELIMNFADSLDGIDQINFTDSVLLSLSGILSQSMDDPMLSANMAKDTFETLKQLREFLGQNEQPNNNNEQAHDDDILDERTDGPK
jgi:regulator of protease activity HflC (stomatin/prohibitin superfamily)